MNVDDLVSELSELYAYNPFTYSDVLSAFSAAGLSARILSSIKTRISKPTNMAYLRGSKRTGDVVINSLPSSNAANIRRLYRILKSQRPSWNYYEPPNQLLNLPVTATNSLEFSPSVQFTTDTTTYERLILGDTYRNMNLVWRMDMGVTQNTTVKPAKVRVVIYWAKKAGNSFTTGSFLTLPDPAAFTVLWDKCYDPEVHGDAVGGRINLKGKITKYNQSSQVFEFGQLRIFLLGSNNTATALSTSFGCRLAVTNK